jgi:hypothetical protein
MPASVGNKRTLAADTSMVSCEGAGAAEAVNGAVSGVPIATADNSAST